MQLFKDDPFNDLVRIEKLAVLDSFMYKIQSKKISLLRKNLDVTELDSNYIELLELQSYVENIADIGVFHRKKQQEYELKLLRLTDQTRRLKEKIISLELENEQLKGNL